MKKKTIVICGITLAIIAVVIGGILVSSSKTTASTSSSDLFEEDIYYVQDTLSGEQEKTASQDYLPAEDITATEAPDEVAHTFEPAMKTHDDNNIENDYSRVIDRILNQYNSEPVAWNNTIDWKEDADVLVKMAEENKGRYKAYGVISKEAGAYGIVLIDNVDFTEFHTNYVYEKWFYTGSSSGEPELKWDKSRLYFTYPVPSGESYIMKTVEIDCGNDSGHMEFCIDG